MKSSVGEGRDHQPDRVARLRHLWLEIAFESHVRAFRAVLSQLDGHFKEPTEPRFDFFAFDQTATIHIANLPVEDQIECEVFRVLDVGHLDRCRKDGHRFVLFHAHPKLRIHLDHVRIGLGPELAGELDVGIAGQGNDRRARAADLGKRINMKAKGDVRGQRHLAFVRARFQFVLCRERDFLARRNTGRSRKAVTGPERIVKRILGGGRTR